MRTAIRLALLVSAFALGTGALGWWTVPLVGAVWGFIAVDIEAPVWRAAAAAWLAWAALLLWEATQGPIGVVAQRVGPILYLPGWLFVVLTLLFPALLAASAAEIAVILRARLTGRRGAGHT